MAKAIHECLIPSNEPPPNDVRVAATIGYVNVTEVTQADKIEPPPTPAPINVETSVVVITPGQPFPDE